jgi:hypothetical protein
MGDSVQNIMVIMQRAHETPSRGLDCERPKLAARNLSMDFMFGQNSAPKQESDESIQTTATMKSQRKISALYDSDSWQNNIISRLRYGLKSIDRVVFGMQESGRRGGGIVDQPHLLIIWSGHCLGLATVANNARRASIRIRSRCFQVHHSDSS